MKVISALRTSSTHYVRTILQLLVLAFTAFLLLALLSVPVIAQESDSAEVEPLETEPEISEVVQTDVSGEAELEDARASEIEETEALEDPLLPEEETGLIEPEALNMLQMAPMMAMPMLAAGEVCTPRGGTGVLAPQTVSLDRVEPAGTLKRVYLDLPSDPFSVQSISVTLPSGTFSNSNGFIYSNGQLNDPNLRSHSYGLNVVRSNGNRTITLNSLWGALSIINGKLLFAINTTNTNYSTWNISVNGTPIGDSMAAADPRDGVEFESSANMVARKAPRTPGPGELDSTTVFVASGEGGTSLNQQVFGTNEFTAIGQPSEWQYNAISYNNDDHWIYGISQKLNPENPCYPGGHLLQINPATGEVHNLGPVVKSGTEDSAFSTAENQLINTGVFEPSNSVLRVTNASTSGTRQTYRVNLPNVGSDAFPTGTVRASDLMLAEDHAAGIGSDTRYAWGIVSPSPMRSGLVPGYNNPSSQVVIERIDLVTNTKTYFDLSTLRTPTGQRIPLAKTWGKAWTYGNGNFGFGTGGVTADQLGIQLKIENQGSANPTFTLVNSLSGLPASYNTDGTSNAGAPPQASDLKAEKFHITPSEHPDIVEDLRDANEYDPSRLYWAVEVTNLGPGRSSGYTLYDHMPEDYQDQEIHLALEDDYEPGGVEDSGREGGPSGTYIFGPLVNGEVRRIVVSAERTGVNPQCAPNSVEIVNNENDPVVGNNEDTAPTECAVAVDKVSTGDIEVDEAGTYLATYDVKVSGFGSYAEVIDRPTIPTGAVMQEFSVVFIDEAGSESAKRVLEPRPDGSYRLDEDSAQRNLTGQGSGFHTYRVEMAFSVDSAQWHEAYGESQATECVAQGGVVNAVTVGGNTDEVCDPVPPPELPNPTLKIIKVGPDGTPLPLDGVRFAVFLPDGTHVADLAAEGEFLTADLEYDTRYVLVETQAPNGYSLLGREVPFQISFKDGQAIAEFDGAPIEISTEPAAQETPFEPVVEVVNVRKGDLPLTGGAGWYMPGILGLLLAGAALFMTKSATSRG